jgi:hypothetical protein
MVSTPEEVNEMARLQKILNGERPEATNLTHIGTTPGTPVQPGGGVTRADVSDMASIMKNFSGATGVKSFKALYDTADEAVKTLKTKADDAPMLAEALNTERTETGVKIGAWEIVKKLRESRMGNPETYFRVRNVNTGQQIKASFMINESARAMVKLLNNGVSLNHPTIREIARLEIEYRTAKSRALEEKRYYKRAEAKDKQFKMDLYEAKYEAARTQALFIREQIKNIFYRLQ